MAQVNDIFFVDWAWATASKWGEQVTWLQENFGKVGVGWDYNRGAFYFRSAADKTLFVLKYYE